MSLLSEHMFDPNTCSKPQEPRRATNGPSRVSGGGSGTSTPQNGAGGRE